MNTRIGVLVSGSGTNLQALIDAFPLGGTAEIAVVISNNEEAYGLARAREASLPAVFVNHRGKSREQFDAELVDCLRQHKVDWVALAGFKRIITSVFLSAYPDRVINIHPALLPSFAGIHAQQQAFDAGVQVAGATVHFVDGGTDTGPIIAQGAVARRPGDTVDDLSNRILSVEHRLFPMVMRWAVEGRLKVIDGRAKVDLMDGESRSLWGD